MGRVLVLGGSWFLGRVITEEALAQGWAVTTFRRGVSGQDVPGVETVRGDRTVRADLAQLARSGPWDVVVDTSGYVPRESGVIARELEAVAGRFVFVSSVSAYTGWPVEPLTEESEVLECPPDADGDFGFDGDPGPSVYGFTKAGCERAVREVFGRGRTVVLRPGVILGPWEYVGRLPWWLRRMERGGRVLAPGLPSRSVQPVDVRDVALFALSAPAGVFNLTGVDSTMEQLLGVCRDVVGSGRVELSWVSDEPWLVEQGVRQWTELPLWRIYRGTWAVSSAAAVAAGFAQRGLRSTVVDTWEWMNAASGAVANERSTEHGITPEKESAILGMWDARERDHCG
ncbi:MAG: NAD-dependent epimerase/dehydratase family protein [Pseudonocardia sp.]